MASHLAEELLSDVEPREQAIRQATLELHACYKAASADVPDHVHVAALEEHCRKFCTLWVALETVDPRSFRIKPKMHFFQEMCEMSPGTSPLAHATYREEELGGSIVAIGRRLGGHISPVSVGMQTLLKFCAGHKLPSIGMDNL